MPRTGQCSECGLPLENPAAKTCTPAHRAVRARRIARERRERAEAKKLPPEQRAMRDAADGAVADELKTVVQQELRPVVREAITEDVLRAARDLVALTADMVAAITEDIQQSQDKILRQRAYSLLAKYTLGNQSIAPQATTPSAPPMQVVFSLPRPGDHGDTETPTDAEVVELPETARSCTECNQPKLDNEFVGSSDRCLECHAKVQAVVRERFGQ